MPNPSTVVMSEDHAGNTDQGMGFVDRVKELRGILESASKTIGDLKEELREAREIYNKSQKNLLDFIGSYSTDDLPLFSLNSLVARPNDWRSKLISTLGLDEEIVVRLADAEIGTVGGLFDFVTNWQDGANGKRDLWVRLGEVSQLTSRNIGQIVNKLDIIPGFNQAYNEVWERYERKSNDEGTEGTEGTEGA